MVFLDGSLHHWFGDKPYTLILALDDATGKPLYGKFFKRESLKAYFEVCYHLFRKYGLRRAFIWTDIWSLSLPDTKVYT